MRKRIAMWCGLILLVVAVPTRGGATWLSHEHKPTDRADLVLKASGKFRDSHIHRIQREVFRRHEPEPGSGPKGPDARHRGHRWKDSGRLHFHHPAAGVPLAGAPLPEPSIGSLFAAGLGWIVAMGRRRSKPA